MNVNCQGIDFVKPINRQISHCINSIESNPIGRSCLSGIESDVASFSEHAKTLVKQPILKRDNLTPLVNPEMVKHLGNYFATFNPGVIKDEKGGVHLLIRAVRGENYPKLPFFSDLIYAHSKDGKHIDIDSMKVIVKPTKRFPNGFEDPRITKVEGENNFNIICTGYDGKHPLMCQWSTTDLTNKEKYKFVGTIGPKKSLIKGGDDKDALLFPEKVNGQYMLFHRVGANIQAVFVDNLNKLRSQHFWKNQIKNLDKTVLMKSKPGTWENKLGGGPPPIKTKDGWLMFYHASDKSGPGRQYCGGVALLDLQHPNIVIARAHNPIMKPKTPYEKGGPVPGVVFPQGLVQNGDKLSVYYGCGDKNVGVAETKISKLVDYVKHFDENGNKKN